MSPLSMPVLTMSNLAVITISYMHVRYWYYTVSYKKETPSLFFHGQCLNPPIYSSVCFLDKFFKCVLFQILSFGYVMRKEPGSTPEETIYLNGVLVPPCPEFCPYIGMPEETLFCQLWNELKNASETAIQEALAGNPSGITSLNQLTLTLLY